MKAQRHRPPAKLDVRMEMLPTMRVARFRVVSESPEAQAWSRLRKWAEQHELLQDRAQHPVFGFNNPPPSRGQKKYGYEFWIRIEPGMHVESGIETMDVPGSWYAVTTCPGVPDPDVWARLLDWVRHSPHRLRRAHELERPHNPLARQSAMIFDLYLPIEPAVQSRLKIRGTDFVMYQVSDLARAATFYREILGLPQEIYSAEWQWAEFNCGNVTLGLHGGVKLPNKIDGGRIALAVEDVHAAYLELKSKGARVTGEPKDYSVCCALEVLDPDGNTVILHQRADGTFGQNSITDVGTEKRIP